MDRRLVAVLSTGLAILVACQSTAPRASTPIPRGRLITPATSSAPAAGLPAHPCSYVAAADVSPVVGGPVGPGAESIGAFRSICAFRASALFTQPGTHAEQGAVYILGIEVSFVDEDTYARWATNRGPAGSGGLVPFFSARAVPSLGDEAFELSGIHFAMVIVAAGRYRVFFDVFAGRTELPVPELELAKVVVPRLYRVPHKGRT